VKLPPLFQETLHELAAPDARRIRLDWGLGSSGAKLTQRDCEQLHDKLVAKRINVRALTEELRGRTALRIAEHEQRRAAKKAAKAARKAP
jgi:hypothetical protein